VADRTICAVRRVLVVTWALGTATGVLLGLFGVQLVSSRFATAGVSPMSRPEVLRALQAARSLPPAAEQVALPGAPPADVAVPPSPQVDVAPARPSAGSASSPASAPPASTLPRPGATAGTFVEAGVPDSSTTSTGPVEEPAPPTSTTAKPDDSKGKSKSDGKASNHSDHPSTSTPSSSTTATASKKPTTTTTPPAPPSRPPAPSPQAAADTRTISSAGGVVAVRYSSGRVELKWARPNPGYQVSVQSNGDSVVVYFYRSGHISQVRAYYRGDAPASDVTECDGTYPNITCRRV
jgi:hypothetical protein